MVDNTIALQVKPLDIATPLMQAAKMRQMESEQQRTQEADNRDAVASEMRGLAPYANSPDFAGRWTQSIDNLAQAGKMRPDIAARMRDQPSVMAMHSVLAQSEDPKLALQKQQLEETTRQHNATIGLGRETLAETKRQHDIAAEAPTVIPYGAGVMNKTGKMIREPGLSEASSYDPMGTPPGGGAPGGAAGELAPTETTGRRAPIKPPAMAGTTSEALAAEGERYALTGKVGQGYSNGRDPIQMAQSRAIKSYGTALANSRGMSGEELAQMWQNSPKWAGWLMGQDGRAAGALGTAVDHLDTARELFKQLHNGTFKLGNNIANKFKEQFGSEAPTNVRTAAQIVGVEVMKAVGAAGAGSADERLAIANAVGDLSKSPEQAEGAITTLQKLAAGQLRTKQRQASAIDLPKGKFEKLVGPRALEVLGNIDKPMDAGGTKQPANAPAGVVDYTSYFK